MIQDCSSNFTYRLIILTQKHVRKTKRDDNQRKQNYDIGVHGIPKTTHTNANFKKKITEFNLEKNCSQKSTKNSIGFIGMNISIAKPRYSTLESLTLPDLLRRRSELYQSTISHFTSSLKPVLGIHSMLLGQFHLSPTSRCIRRLSLVMPRKYK